MIKSIIDSSVISILVIITLMIIYKYFAEQYRFSEDRIGKKAASNLYKEFGDKYEVIRPTNIILYSDDTTDIQFECIDDNEITTDITRHFSIIKSTSLFPGCNPSNFSCIII